MSHNEIKRSNRPPTAAEAKVTKQELQIAQNELRRLELTLSVLVNNSLHKGDQDKHSAEMRVTATESTQARRQLLLEGPHLRTFSILLAERLRILDLLGRCRITLALTKNSQSNSYHTSSPLSFLPERLSGKQAFPPSITKLLKSAPPGV
jgi:hypothetical protein